MSQQISLRIGSIGHDDKKAPAGGRTIYADRQGPPSHRIFYRVPTSKIGVASSTAHGRGGKVGVAYLKPDERATLKSQSVLTSTELEVEGAAQGQYVLWQAD